jgi:hypothetical protein
MTAHRWQLSYSYNTRPAHFSPSRTLTNHILLRITTSACIYAALDNQSDSAPFTDQSALTVTTGLGSAHQDWYKRAQLQPRNQSVVSSQ